MEILREMDVNSDVIEKFRTEKVVVIINVTCIWGGFWHALIYGLSWKSLCYSVYLIDTFKTYRKIGNIVNRWNCFMILAILIKICMR